MYFFLAIFAASFLVSLLTTPLAGRVAKHWNIVARPGGRRQHSGLVPKLGGLPLLAGLLFGIGLVYLLLPPTGDDALRLRGVLLGTLILVVGGLLDDRYDLPPWVQFLVQLLGAATAMAHIVFIELFTNPFAGSAVWTSPPFSWVMTVDGELIWLWRPLALLVTLLWIVGMINTVNWLDGLDGLAAGVGTVAALLFAWHSYRLGQTAVAAFPLALAGALLGFLPFNFAPARIFLGSAGAYLLGYNLAALAILSPAKIATALLVMAIPILDGVWRVIDRLRQRRSPFHGDRGHLHFRLADRGWPIRGIVLGYYLVTIAFGLIAIFAPGIFKLFLFLLLGALLLLLFSRLQIGEEKV